jgi:mannose-1-phosphate guanylyltransferase
MLYAVIMAGGSGTRFWLWGRKKTPKQLLKITGQETMIKHTVDRIIGEIHYWVNMVGLTHVEI